MTELITTQVIQTHNDSQIPFPKTQMNNHGFADVHANNFQPDNPTSCQQQTYMLRPLGTAPTLNHAAHAAIDPIHTLNNLRSVDPTLTKLASTLQPVDTESADADNMQRHAQANLQLVDDQDTYVQARASSMEGTTDTTNHDPYNLFKTWTPQRK